MHALISQSKNVVFDVGRVLLSFEPEAFIDRLLSPAAQGRLHAQDVFGNELWLRLDEGVVSEEEVARCAARRAGDDALWPEALHVIEHFQEYMHALPTCDMIPLLHAQGKKVYVLSNYGIHTFARAEARFSSVFAQMDGMVISAREKLIKPDPRIYRLLLTRYGLAPEESVFIDDRPENVAGARRAGMQGIVFTGMESLD